MKINNKAFYLTISAIILIQIIISLQGFNVCDEGFSLTFYQQIFNNPSTVEYNFAYYLSGVIGGVWYKLFPEGGILWFRFLAILINTLTFILAFKILKQVIKPSTALIGLTMVVFVNDFGFIAFYHNHLTAFLAILSVYFLLEGLKSKHYLSLIIAGVLIGVNVFTRLPNMVLVIVVLIVPAVQYWDKKPIIESVKPMSFIVLGLLIGVSLILLVLSILGHVQIMRNVFLTLLNLGENENSTHGFAYLIQSYIHNYKMVLLELLKVLFVGVFVILLSKLFRKIWYSSEVIYFIGFLILVFLFKEGGVFIVYAIGFIGVFAMLLDRNQPVLMKAIALIAFLMMVCIPIGSSGGIYDIGYITVWLAIPLFMHFISQLYKLEFKLNSRIIHDLLSKDHSRYLMVIFMVSFFVAKTFNISQEAYFDPGSRLDKTHSIDNKFAKGIYTTKEQADVVNDLLNSLSAFVQPNDYLLAYDNIPMVHFLTETRPFMYNPWIWIYDENSFDQKIRKAEVEIDELPIIVQQKFNTIGEFSIPMENYMAENKDNSFLYNKGRMTIMNAFLKRNQYKIVWSNAYFNIYQSNIKSKD